MYNRLFTKILDSSIWLEPLATRVVWITFLAAMDQDGFCSFACPANVARRAGVTQEECDQALTCLMSPDANSSDPDNNGKRLEKVPGGYLVLNAVKYREILNREIQREQTRIRVARHRKCNGEVTPCNAPVTVSNEKVTPSETEAFSESNTKEEESSMYHKDSRSVLHVLNEASGLKFREVDTNLSLISQRLRESGVSFDGVRQMIQRQAKLWKGTEMEQYLRPSTLFNKTKFDGYYAMREAPTTPTKSANQKFDPSVQSVDHYLNAIEKL